MNRIWLLFFVGLFGPAYGQEERPARIVHEALISNGAHGILRELTRAAPHRLSGSPGNTAAVTWAKRKMKELGLTNVRGETIMVSRWERGSRCSVRILAAEDGLPGPLSALALGGSVGTGGPLVAEVMEVTDMNELKRRRAEAKGKIVLFNRPFDRSLVLTFLGYGGAVGQRSRGAIEAAKVGAVGALVRSVTSMDDDEPHTGAMGYEDGVPRIPAAALGVQSANRLSALLKDGPVRVRFEMDCKNLPPVPAENVVGEIRGREKPDEIVLIGAHLDAWDVGVGAHDDGAGCSHCLEAARLILATGQAPRRTIRVVLFNNEENGLAGGRGYLEAHKGEIDRHVAAIESDSGGFAPRGFGVSAGSGGLAALKSVEAVLEQFSLGRLFRGGGGADIGPLGAQGVPTLGLRIAPERYFDVHHSHKDVLAAVHPRELALGAAALAIMTLELAERKDPLPRRAR